MTHKHGESQGRYYWPPNSISHTKMYDYFKLDNINLKTLEGTELEKVSAYKYPMSILTSTT